MAVLSTRKANQLDPSFVLAPERYDPRRNLAGHAGAAPLSDVAVSIRKTVDSLEGLGACVVLDTSDARDGVIVSRKSFATEIGSAKKVFQVGDVLISRLRPYLRQVAYVDRTTSELNDATLLCSTEFFVLRSVDDRSIAFLAPFLLSAQVQQVLAASQEGGHHPRVREATLLTLPIPSHLLETRVSDSIAVEHATDLHRQSEREFRSFIDKAEKAILEWPPAT